MPILTQETYVHLPIFFTAYAVQDLGELEAIPADFRVRGVVHLGQAASPSQPDSHTLPHTGGGLSSHWEPVGCAAHLQKHSAELLCIC